VLSLNQGYTQYKSKFGPAVAKQKVQQGAAAALRYLTIPEGFIGGPIDLAATGDLGNGYERGAILSKSYPGSVEIDESIFHTDFDMLLDAYDLLRTKIGIDILEVLPPTTEEEFQEAAASVGETGKVYEPPAGQLPRPPRSPRAPRTGYKRDPRISNIAIVGADYCCAIDEEHKSFTSKLTKRNFVEAHHFIPIQFQDDFKFSLDVPENVVVLCPTCHRKLHHGLAKDKSFVLKKLYASANRRYFHEGWKPPSMAY
jgi:5-methylcytosine-specific restriction protein A